MKTPSLCLVAPWLFAITLHAALNRRATLHHRRRDRPPRPSPPSTPRTSTTSPSATPTRRLPGLEHHSRPTRWGRAGLNTCGYAGLGCCVVFFFFQKVDESVFSVVSCWFVHEQRRCPQFGTVWSDPLPAAMANGTKRSSTSLPHVGAQLLPARPHSRQHHHDGQSPQHDRFLIHHSLKC